MLASSSHAVVGSSDPEALAAYLCRFGLERQAAGVLTPEAAQGLYGHEKGLEEIVLRTPGAEAGWLRLVRTPAPRPSTGPFDSRPLAFDLYTRNIEESLEIAARAGGRCGELVEYEVGSLAVREAETIGPDELRLVLLQASRRRPSVLDGDEGRLHSEVHSVVWSVPNMEEALAPWRDEAGLQVLVDAEIRGDILSRLMGLPRPEVPVRFTLLADAAVTPARLELLEFLEDRGEIRPSWPLAPGLHALGFRVADLTQVLAALASYRFGSVVEVAAGVHSRARAVTGTAPGGVRLELWQEG